MDPKALQQALGVNFSELSLKQKADLAKLFKDDVKTAKDGMKEEKVAIFNAITENCLVGLVPFLDLKGYSYNGETTVDGETRKLQVIIRYAVSTKKEDANGADPAEAPVAEATTEAG